MSYRHSEPPIASLSKMNDSLNQMLAHALLQIVSVQKHPLSPLYSELAHMIPKQGLL